MNIRTEDEQTPGRCAPERRAGETRPRCGKKCGPDAELTFPEGRAYQHLEGLFLGQIYYMR